MNSLRNSISLSEIKNVAIIGASGGIGKAFTSYFLSLGSLDSLYLFSRTKITHSDSKIHSYSLDFLSEQSFKCVQGQLNSNLVFDLIIIATGLLHDETIYPEKSISSYSLEASRRIYEVNTIGPSLVFKYFHVYLNKNSTSLLISLCGRVGSIEDNRLGGWYSYRSSKAALMMMIKSFSIELARLNPNAIVAGLHPGTVNTSLSQPFQRYIKKSQVFTTDYAVKQMLHTLSQLTQADSGFQFAYDGSKISF